MNGSVRIPVATFAGIAATCAFLVSGGIWLGNLQTRIDEHTGLLAHIDADQRLDHIEASILTINNRISDADNLLHALATEEERRHREILGKLQQMEWQPYLKEE